MRAVVIEKLGGPEVLNVIEHPDPEPQADQVVVQVAAAGVNFMDIYQRQGVGGYKPGDFPVVPAPIAVTVPAPSAPGTTGKSPGLYPPTPCRW